MVVLVAAGCTSSGAPAPSGPAAAAADTPARAQLRWLFAAVAHLPMSDAEMLAHFDGSYLATVGPAELNRGLQGLAGARLVSIKVGEPSTAVATVAAGGAVRRGRVALTVDSRGLIADVGNVPAAGPVPTTWAGVDTALRSVAPQVHLLVANVSNGSCQPVHSIDPGAAARIGSAFKLYVLQALGAAVAAGTAGWDQPLTITTQLKSLRSGVLQYEPTGTQISVRDTAGKMISLSDNTATDMLINLVGRSAVEAALTATGMANPALDRPFLTTHELFVLALERWPVLAKRYLTANEAGRRTLLASTVDPAPLPTVGAARALLTRDLGSLDYFASASDICRAYTSLAALTRRPGLSPIGQVLSFNDSGLDLDPAQWKTTWYKGGYEPQAWTLAYLATTRTGQSYVVTVLTENRSQPIDAATAPPVLLAAIKGAFILAARR
ncbi:MAG TPA: serine hydrolase [Mycobacteriales bacterium]